MALGTRFDWEYARGDSRKLRFTIVDTAGAPVDLTTVTEITFAFAKQDPSASIPAPQGSTAIVSKTIGSGVVVEDAVNGVVRVDMGSGDTTGLNPTPAVLYYEVQVELGGEFNTVMFGNLTLARDLIAPGP